MEREREREVANKFIIKKLSLHKAKRGKTICIVLYASLFGFTNL